MRPYARVAAILVLAYSGLRIVHMLLTYDTMVFEESKSPSGDQVAMMIGLGEGASIPYGEELVVQPWWMPMKKTFRTPIFRGYCGGPTPLKWKSDTELEIRCDAPSGVEVKRTQYGAVHVTYRDGATAEGR